VAATKSASQADTPSVCIIYTAVGQHFNWHSIAQVSWQ